MAWVYERVPALGVRRSLHIFPWLFRWWKSKIPLKAADVESVLKAIDSTQVLPIHPFGKEKKLLDIKHVLKPEDDRFDARKLEKKQMDEIKLLKKRCAELERVNLRIGAKGKEVVDEKDEIIEEDVEEVEKSEEAVDVELAHDVDVNFDDVVDLMVQNVVADLEKQNNEVGGADSGNPSADERGAGHDANLLVQNNPDGLEQESGNDESGSGEESDAGSAIATSEVEKTTLLKSSIVDIARTRGDRVKKRKPLMFVTPPSSTPKRKRKTKKQGNSIVDVDKEGKSPAKTSMDVYKGRANFCGHEEASAEERKLLTDSL